MLEAAGAHSISCIETDLSLERFIFAEIAHYNDMYYCPNSVKHRTYAEYTTVCKQGKAERSRTLFDGTLVPGAIDENNQGQNNVNVGHHANNNFGDVLENDSSEDTIAEADLCTSPPLSPTAKRLHKANVLAREGKISEHEKIKMKEDVIRSKGPKTRAAAIFVPQVAQTQGTMADRHELSCHRLAATGKVMRSGDNKRKYEGKMEDIAPKRVSRMNRNYNENRRHASPPGQKEETKKPSGPNHPRTNNSKRRIVTHSSENSPVVRGNTKPQPRSHSKLKQPQNIRREKMSKDREDLHLLHRLRAQGEGESSSHLEDLHQAISQLVDEEENLLQLHMDSIQENAQLLTEEGNLLAKVQGEDVVDYDIDVYAERLDRILERKIKMYTDLQKNLKTFRSHLAEEESLSAALGKH